jgi:hypothetical protein
MKRILDFLAHYDFFFASSKKQESKESKNLFLSNSIFLGTIFNCVP